MEATTLRRLTIMLLVVAVTGCLVLELDSRPWLQLAARVVAFAAFAAALIAFALGLPRLRDGGDPEAGGSAPQRARAPGTAT